MAGIISKFWEWYERHLTLNIAIASILFSWQIVHLVWLFSDVIVPRLFGISLWHLSGFHEKVIVVVDYIEIPALISTGLIYVNQLRKKYDTKSLIFLLMLASQFFHIFWITDEFVISTFTGEGEFVNLPPTLAWVAILIDYLEVPVMIETFRKLYQATVKKDVKEAAEAFEEKL